MVADGKCATAGLHWLSLGLGRIGRWPSPRVWGNVSTLEETREMGTAIGGKGFENGKVAVLEIGRLGTSRSDLSHSWNDPW